MVEVFESEDLTAKLAEKGIEIDPSIASSPFLQGLMEPLKVGDVGASGSIIGFCRGEADPEQFNAVMWDETKEGEKGGVYVFPCNLKGGVDALSPSGELAPEMLEDLHANLENAVEMAEMGVPTPLDQIPEVIEPFEHLEKIEVPDRLREALQMAMLEYLRSEEFIAEHPEVSAVEEDGEWMLMPSGEPEAPDDSLFE